MSMMVFTCKFQGHWPVGACAVIVAESDDQARRMMRDELVERGLATKNEAYGIRLEQVDLKKSGVIILNDGNY